MKYIVITSEEPSFSRRLNELVASRNTKATIIILFHELMSLNIHHVVLFSLRAYHVLSWNRLHGIIQQIQDGCHFNIMTLQ